MTALIFDTETHDKEEPQIIEAAWIYVSFGRPTVAHCAPEDIRLKPSKPITLGAMSTHGIMDEDLVDCEDSALFELPPSDFLIGHNIDFDWQAAGKPPGAKRICTLALARELWPTLDCHTQSALIYHLDRHNARQRLQGAHGTACDVLLCKTILDAILDERPAIDSWEALWKFSEEARIPKSMQFGKWKGTAMKDVPADYKRWLLGQPDVDDYLRIALGGQPKEKLLFCPQ